jgi:hypothetical protein
MPRRAWESRPGTALPTPRRRTTLCGMVSNNPAALYHPLPYGRRTTPSKEDGRTLEGKTHDYSTPARDGAVTSSLWERSPPSPSTLCDLPAIATPSRPLHHHPRRCGSMRRQDTATPATVPCTASCQRRPRILARTALGRVTPTLPPSKLLLDAHRTHHDALPEARFARTTVYSVALYVMPPHVARTVRHACKLLPPWPIKGEAVPQPQGGDGQRSLARSSPSPRYRHLPQSVPLRHGGPTSSPASLVAPSASTTVHRKIVPRAHARWTYSPGRIQDNTQCH